MNESKPRIIEDSDQFLGKLENGPVRAYLWRRAQGKPDDVSVEFVVRGRLAAKEHEFSLEELDELQSMITKVKLQAPKLAPS